jgi:hypothetical protein
MNGIRESSDEFEYSSGWRKLIKDTKSDKANEEVKLKIDELQLKLDGLGSAITNIAQKDIVREKVLEKNTGIDEETIRKINEMDSAVKQIRNDIDFIKTELTEHKNIICSQLAILGEIMEMEKNREIAREEAQKGLINNIFKKR